MPKIKTPSSPSPSSSSLTTSFAQVQRVEEAGETSKNPEILIVSTKQTSGTTATTDPNRTKETKRTMATTTPKLRSNTPNTEQTGISGNSSRGRTTTPSPPPRPTRKRKTPDKYDSIEQDELARVCNRSLRVKNYIENSKRLSNAKFSHFATDDGSWQTGLFAEDVMMDVAATWVKAKASRTPALLAVSAERGKVEELEEPSAATVLGDTGSGVLAPTVDDTTTTIHHDEDCCLIKQTSTHYETKSDCDDLVVGGTNIHSGLDLQGGGNKVKLNEERITDHDGSTNEGDGNMDKDSAIDQNQQQQNKIAQSDNDLDDTLNGGHTTTNSVPMCLAVLLSEQQQPLEVEQQDPFASTHDLSILELKTSTTQNESQIDIPGDPDIPMVESCQSFDSSRRRRSSLRSGGGNLSPRKTARRRRVVQSTATNATTTPRRKKRHSDPVHMNRWVPVHDTPLDDAVCHFTLKTCATNTSASESTFTPTSGPDTRIQISRATDEGENNPIIGLEKSEQDSVIETADESQQYMPRRKNMKKMRVNSNWTLPLNHPNLPKKVRLCSVALDHNDSSSNCGRIRHVRTGYVATSNLKGRKPRVGETNYSPEERLARKVIRNYCKSVSSQDNGAVIVQGNSDKTNPTTWMSPVDPSVSPQTRTTWDSSKQEETECMDGNERIQQPPDSTANEKVNRRSSRDLRGVLSNAKRIGYDLIRITTGFGAKAARDNSKSMTQKSEITDESSDICEQSMGEDILLNSLSRTNSSSDDDMDLQASFSSQQSEFISKVKRKRKQVRRSRIGNSTVKRPRTMDANSCSILDIAFTKDEVVQDTPTTSIALNGEGEPACNRDAFNQALPLVKSDISVSEVPLEPYEVLPGEAPKIPEELKDNWHYDEESRVLLGRFSTISEISTMDKLFLLKMMERDDISVVTEGMLRGIRSYVPVDEIENAFGENPYHKFRRFDRMERDGLNVYVESNQFVSMKVTDYIDYLTLLTVEGGDRAFAFTDNYGREHRIDDASRVVFYMIDVDVPKFLPRMNDEYKRAFKVPECLPGGSLCMMNYLPESARPFMGPNMYLTPPGSFTSFHQDGFGTVDSGHTCISGFNEVVMLRRLPEEHKSYAMRQAPKSVMHDYPHGIEMIDGDFWPTKSAIKEWKDMNYCPSVFILQPGQHLHINKGRLHCFRKLSPEPLHERDCHESLRRELVKNLPKDLSVYLCFSIAFDWMYMGRSSEAIKSEFGSSLNCADLCHKKKVHCLAVPATALLQIGKSIAGKKMKRSFLLSKIAEADDALEPEESDLCLGVNPLLQTVIQRELEMFLPIGNKNFCQSIRPDSHEDPLLATTEPYGSDYVCKLCKAELANAYFHCMGCETLLSKDFNICRGCYENEDYKQFILMHGVDNAKLSDVNHTGSAWRDNLHSNCCHRGRCKAPKCGMCRQCSCKCHQEFKLMFRFFGKERLEQIASVCNSKTLQHSEALPSIVDDHNWNASDAMDDSETLAECGTAIIKQEKA